MEGPKGEFASLDVTVAATAAPYRKKFSRTPPYNLATVRSKARAEPARDTFVGCEEARYPMRPLLASLLGTLLLHAGAMAEFGPRPPCDNPPIPNYASIDAQPAIRAWTEDELRQLDWRPEGCLSWAGTTHQVVALSGSFSSAATLAALLNSRTGVVVYRMRVSRLDADRATISIENASPVDLFFLIKLFDPGALQTSLFLDQLRPGVWRVYEITRTTRGTSMFAEGHLDSYANREIALFRYLAGRTARSKE